MVVSGSFSSSVAVATDWKFKLKLRGAKKTRPEGDDE